MLQCHHTVTFSAVLLCYLVVFPFEKKKQKPSFFTSINSILLIIFELQVSAT